jgi:hypothetical protein
VRELESSRRILTKTDFDSHVGSYDRRWLNAAIEYAVEQQWICMRVERYSTGRVAAYRFWLGRYVPAATKRRRCRHPE